MTVLITLTFAGADTGPFDLYSDTDAFTTPFETGVSKAALTSGYTSTLVPDLTGTIRVQSTSELCDNYIDIVIGATTTTTTTAAPPEYTSWVLYDCISGFPYSIAYDPMLNLGGVYQFTNAGNPHCGTIVYADTGTPDSTLVINLERACNDSVHCPQPL